MLIGQFTPLKKKKKNSCSSKSLLLFNILFSRHISHIVAIIKSKEFLVANVDKQLLEMEKETN